MNISNRITVNIENGIATVTLNRPEKHNALDIAMFEAIDQTIKKLKRNKMVRVVIVTGAGEDFCSGLDVKSVLSSTKKAFQLLFKWSPFSANLAQRVSAHWRKIPCPVIFAIHGRCWGGGLQIALGGDFRIASPDSSWSILEGRWGIIPDMAGSLAFSNLLQQDIALELAMTAKQLSGDEAKSLGLVTHINDNPLEAAQQLAMELIERSPDALAATKRLFYKSWHSSDGWTLFRESYYQLKLLMNKNQRIAVKRQLIKAANKDNSDTSLPHYKHRQFK